MFNLNPVLKKRINAFTLDLSIIIVVNYFLMASFTDFLKVVFFHFPISTQLFLIHKFKYVHSVSMLSLMFSYFTIFYYTTNGQTMGKMIMGLKVNSKSDEMTLKESMMRSIAYIFCAWFASLPFLVPFFRKDFKSVADIFSGTTVALEEKKEIVQQTEFQLTLMDFEAQNTLPIENEEEEYLEHDKAS